MMVATMTECLDWYDGPQLAAFIGSDNPLTDNLLLIGVLLGRAPDDDRDEWCMVRVRGRTMRTIRRRAKRWDLRTGLGIVCALSRQNGWYLARDAGSKLELETGTGEPWDGAWTRSTVT